MAATATLPTQFGRYRVVQTLGAGGMGTVFLATDTQLDRRVALKVPHLDDPSPEVRERFLREARLAASINHQNLCGVHDVGEVDGVPYFVMPFLEGALLSELTGLGQIWQPREAVSLVRCLAGALGALHAGGLMHRDLKPSNIMLRPDGSPVLMDFGLARTVGGADRLTRSGSPLGTPVYMSPEQATGDVDRLGPPTDIWSLGVLLYQLLAGRLPFQADDLRVLYGQIIFADATPPSQWQPSVPTALDAICARAMAKRIEQRYPSVTEFAAALDGWLATASAEANATVPVVAPPSDLRTVCPNCRKLLKLPKRSQAKRFRCPGCHAAIPSVSEQETRMPGDLSGTLAPAGRRLPRKWLVSAAAVVLLGTVCGALALHGGSGRSGETVAPPPPADGLPRLAINSVGMKLALVPAGKFLRGAAPGENGIGDDLPRREVTLSHAFYVGVCEVTQEEYEKVMGTNPSLVRRDRAGRDTGRFPVENLTWTEAVEFCRRLSALPAERRAGRGYRLPTEAEWEYACRAGGPANDPYSFGSAISGQSANYTDAGLKRTTAVASYAPNALGLYDLHGNVWEWCADWYDAKAYQSGDNVDPQGPKQSPEGMRVIRGGSWTNQNYACRSAYRTRLSPELRNDHTGFRVVVDVR